MKTVIVMLLVTACERSSPPPAGEAAAVGKDMRAAMTDLAAYTDRLYTVMRGATDCDAAAKQLETLAPEFEAISPRMMKVKERLDALPSADRDRIKHDSQDLIEAMKKRFADADVIEQKGKDCEKSSAAFAAIAPKVMFVKKH
jgi:DNA repair ATPase RecN